MYFAHDTTDVISLFNAINFIPYFIIEKSRLITNLIVGRLDMVFMGRWSIGNVQIILIYLWYNRFIPNPNSFDVASCMNHCDMELDISMILEHLDLCSANNVDISRSQHHMCFTGIHHNTEMESSINWWCARMTKKWNYAGLGWREKMTLAQYPVHSCSKVMGFFFCGDKIWCLFLRYRLEILCVA